MKIGRLMQRVVVERPVTAQSDTGEETITWTLVATVWGAVEPMRGRERLFGAQVVAEMDTRIILRAGVPIEGINAKWRLRCGNVTYNIVSIADLQMAGRELEIMCLSGANDG